MEERKRRYHDNNEFLMRWWNITDNEMHVFRDDFTRVSCSEKEKEIYKREDITIVYKYK